MAVTTIKSTYSLEVESVRAGGVGTSLDGVEVRSVAAGSCLCSVGNPPGSAGVPPASLYLQTACHPRPLPCKAHQTRLYGVLFHRAKFCAGGTLPGGLCGRDARAPGGSFFTSRSASTASMAKGGADGRNDHQIDLLAGGRIRARWRSWQVTGWRRSPKCCGGLLFVFGGQSTRERGRPARILIPANSLPSKATPLQGAPNPPLRGALPSCRGLCGRDARAPGWGLCGRDARAPGWGLCGRDARAPGWSLCGRDARAPRWGLLLPPARPLAGPSRAWSVRILVRAGYLFS